MVQYAVQSNVIRSLSKQQYALLREMCCYSNNLFNVAEYKPEQPYMGTFSGKRVHRGLYKSKNGTLINADVNGSANIFRKCKQNLNFEKLYNGLLASPQRIRLS